MKTTIDRPSLAMLGLAVCSALQPVRAEQAVEKAERIEVTGTRLASSDTESASPIAIIKAEEIRLEGYQQLELLLANYPQFNGGWGNRLNNSNPGVASGTATLNLRSLGDARTLTLVNGRRLPPGDVFALSPDINQIPPALIQRIEILTGGASAVYGSDAIAGVVNFVLNEHFQGAQGDISYDFFNHQQHSTIVQEALRRRNFNIPGDKSNDGATTTATLTMGGDFSGDKGNASISMRYLKSEAVAQSERDYSACQVNFDVLCEGSPTTYPGRFQDAGASGFPSWTMNPANGGVRSYLASRDAYNFAPLQYFQRPAERYGFNAFANYEFSPNARLYAQFGYMDDRTVVQLAESGVFGTSATQVRFENPLLSDDWRNRLVFYKPDGTPGTGPGTVADVVIFRRNVEGGARVFDLRHTAFREVLGLKGDAAKDWEYDVYFQDAKVQFADFHTGDFSRTRVQRALDVVVDPATGRAVCAAAVNGSDPECVPWNIWTLTGVTAEALRYLQIPSMETGFTTQRIFGATMTTDLGRYGAMFPSSRKPVEIAFGFERRVEKLRYEPDAAAMAGDLGGTPQPLLPVDASLEVKDVFGEIRAPVSEFLDLSASYRHSDYADKSTRTYGAGFIAGPRSSLRVRGSYQRAARAPNLLELYTPQTMAFARYTDPCAGPAPERPFEECRRTGVAPNQYGQIPVSPIGNAYIDGGNPELSVETGTTYTLGLVLNPVRDLAVTIDYWDIRMDDAIGGIDVDTVLTRCLETGEARFCGLITRDPRFGSLWLDGAFVKAVRVNIGSVRTSGADVAVNYRIGLPRGHAVALDGLGTWLRKLSVEAIAGDPAIDCAGQVFNACTDLPLPKWRHRFRATWRPPWNFEIAGTWRYIHSTALADFKTAITALPAVSYFDIAGTWSLSKRVTLRGGINNVADRDPPPVFSLPPGVNGNTFAQVYDVLGRHVFMSLSLKF